MTPPRPYILHEANYRQLLDDRPTVAVLPWGATEAHNYHLPHGTDVIEATTLAERAAELAYAAGARPIVLPAIPFGNDSQQLDQVATISIRTATATAILRDVAESLASQGIEKLLILNGHGGNDFKPLVRDLQPEVGILMVVVNFWQMAPEAAREIFTDPGDHAGDLETSFLLHTSPDWVRMEQAGKGAMNPAKIPGIRRPGVWTPRPWSATHPDTGCGDPSAATANKGRRYFDAVAEELAQLLKALHSAKRGDLPFV